ncbi:TetR/AcrR family transcriptional regulator [Streptomyces spiralis]|uniref:TetR/AcrR family transcriptional regulator n=1 Tax=Streptomyces spiralis TaxID=66376 RepID=UPI0033C29A2D
MAEQKKHRRSPHDGEATREALTDAAEKLFAEQGVEAVSIRAINAAAGLAPAAVHYHFGSKEALLEAVFERRGRAVLSDIVQRCDRLLEQGGRPDPRDIVDALVSPYVALLERDQAGGARWLSIIGQLALNQDERMEASAAPATDRLQNLARMAFPDADPAQLEATLRLTIEALILLMARRPSDWSAPGSSGPTAMRETLIDFAVGGLSHALRCAGGRPTTAS